MSFDPEQFIKTIIRPALTQVDLWSYSAEQLLAGTCAVESDFGKYLCQTSGPALGPYQMEPLTHDDLWQNYLSRKNTLSQKIISVTGVFPFLITPRTLASNLIYSTIMARIKYLVIPEKIPKYGDIEGQAAYWKKYYNTSFGQGKVEDYLEKYDKYVKSFYTSNMSK